MSFLFSVFWLALLLYLWFNTPAVPEYINWVIGSTDGELLFTYLDCIRDGPFISFPEFLYENKPSFITKLLSCQFCTGLVLSTIISALLFISIIPTACMFVSGLLLYRGFVKIKLL